MTLHTWDGMGATVPVPNVPGFLALSWSDPTASALAESTRLVPASQRWDDQASRVRLLHWGSPESDGNGCFLFSRGPRHADADLSIGDVGAILAARDRSGLADIMPAFAAVLRETGTGVVVATDRLGFRHLYTARGTGWAAVSTSARVLAGLSGPAIDREALAVQSLVGWQFRDRTLFAGVRKIPAGCGVDLRHGICETWSYSHDELPDELTLDEAVAQASDVLRTYLAAYVEDHPDALLQLTGGQDSRILLSAIPPELRRHVRAMTLEVPGSEDALIARRLSKSLGMSHVVAEMGGLEGVDPAVALDVVQSASSRLECMADPVAAAAIALSETGLPQGRRISGLGGEVARGFYYVGSRSERPVTRRRAKQLATWRMLANEAATSELFVPSFAQWARQFVHEEIYDLLADSGHEWLTATDEFYLWQRLQRWAGVVDSSVCFDRDTVDPMLDPRFLRVARGLRPTDKYGSLFLARLQIELDPALATVPLDGRPAPKVYAHVGPHAAARIQLAMGTRLVKKIAQRARGQRRSAPGVATLSRLVVEHWRRNPDLLSPIAEQDVIRTEWLEAFASGKVEAQPATVALLANIGVGMSVPRN